MVERELLSAADPSSWTRFAFESGLPLLVKKLRPCGRAARGALLHSGDLLKEACDPRDSDAACRRNIAAARDAAVRAAHTGVGAMH